MNWVVKICSLWFSCVDGEVWRMVWCLICIVLVACSVLWLFFNLDVIEQNRYLEFLVKIKEWKFKLGSLHRVMIVMLELLLQIVDLV